MKILYIITGLGVGGAEVQVLTLADKFADAGHQVAIVHLTGEALLEPSNKLIQVIGMGMSKSPISFFLAIFRLKKIIKKFKPDVVHSHMFHANIITRVARIFVKMPWLISTAHNSNEGGALRMGLYRLTNPLADFSTNVSEEAVQSFLAKKAFKSGELHAVYNGIDTVKFSPNSADRDAIRQEMNCQDLRVLVAVGRLAEAKDYPNLIRAFADVVKKNSKCILWIVGDGPLKSELITLVAGLKINEKVKFLGLRRDVPKLLNAADVFVLSSAWEGLPLVVGEAMACQKVVVVTNCGGVAEFVGDAGFLIPARDHEALAKRLGSALSLTEAEHFQLGVSARQRILDKFSIEAAVKRWEEIYRHDHTRVN